MPEKDQFSSTMRIDIPPEFLDKKEAPAAPATPPPPEPAPEVGADEQGDFTSTMRIDIPPDSLVQSEIKRTTVETTTKAHGKTVIHIPKKKAEATPIGDPDFQELLQSIYDAALITDLKGMIISVNVRAIQFFGFNTQEFCANSVISIISGATSSLLTTIWETLQNDRFVLIQACCARKDGSIFPAEISVNRLNLSGKYYLSFFIRDVTLRKEAEERLRTRYLAIQNSGSGIVIADIRANIEYCNPAMARMWGMESAEDVQGRNLRDFLCHPETADAIVEMVVRGETWSNELEMKRPEEPSFFVQVSAAANFNSDGELTGMVLSLLDISNIKFAQQQLETYANQLREKNEQMEDDLNMAREIQLAFLPRDYPAFPQHVSLDKSALRFSHVYFPSGAVGGDFFNIIPVSATQAGIFISDVVGHGMRAALVVASLRGLIEQLAPVAHDPGTFLTMLNQAYNGIFKQTAEVIFATAFYMVIDISTGRMRYANAGHPFPFCLKRDRDLVETLEFSEGAKGPALGLFEGTRYRADECTLSLNDVILLYTDGLSEAKRPDLDEEYENERMGLALRKGLRMPPMQLLSELVADAHEFSGSKEFEDDVCLLAVEVSRIGSDH